MSRHFLGTPVASPHACIHAPSDTSRTFQVAAAAVAPCACPATTHCAYNHNRFPCVTHTQKPHHRQPTHARTGPNGYERLSGPPACQRYTAITLHYSHAAQCELNASSGGRGASTGTMWVMGSGVSKFRSQRVGGSAHPTPREPCPAGWMECAVKHCNDRLQAVLLGFI